MSNNNPSIKEIKAIAEWVSLTNDIREVSLKFGDVEFAMSRNEGGGQVLTAPAPARAPEPSSAAPTPAPAPVTQPEAPTLAAADVPAGGAADSLAPGEVVIKAPMVGTFYAAPRPGAPAFVTPGDTVSEDSILGIVEVMKLMNNLEAKVSGTVSRILVENGEAVEYDQPLMVIQTDA